MVTYLCLMMYVYMCISVVQMNTIVSESVCTIR